MSEEELPSCFGYFMSGNGCDNCKEIQKCYARWKANGEPKKPSTRRKKICVLDKRKCNCDH